MSRHWSHEHPLPDGRPAGFNLIAINGVLRVRFTGPDGKRWERSTGATSKGDARSRARAIIADAYAPPPAAEPKAATWEEVLDFLARTPDLRPDSVRAYRTAVKALRAVLPDLSGPGALTAVLAERFKREFLTGEYRRGNAADAKAYKRSPESCKTYLRSLKSLWKKHLRPAGLVPANPWADVPFPNAPRNVRVQATDEATVAEFVAWLAKKYPGWGTPGLWYLVKMLTASRTIDICMAKTADLRADALVMSAEASKTRAARVAPLPPDVVADLRRVAGPEWLWERTVEEAKVHRRSVKTARQTAYSPSTWRWSMVNIAREFNKTRPGKPGLRLHDLRARTATLVAQAVGTADGVAQALGMDPQTARRYIDHARAWDGPAALRNAADAIRMKK